MNTKHHETTEPIRNYIRRIYSYENKKVCTDCYKNDLSERKRVRYSYNECITTLYGSSQNTRVKCTECERDILFTRAELRQIVEEDGTLYIKILSGSPITKVEKHATTVTHEELDAINEELWKEQAAKSRKRKLKRDAGESKATKTSEGQDSINELKEDATTISKEKEEKSLNNMLDDILKELERDLQHSSS